MEVKRIKKVIENTLNKNKANNVVTIDLKKKSYIADYMIIASEPPQGTCSPCQKIF